ncbi:glycosyl hydrolase family 92 domain-containing protein [Trichoderma breve]|uniref:Glycosyl hydrolase family 92 domain-containing protein n=1 Tax=Trichoderma breve TaxID=2034170 RepID=A0A9W9E354_9HYPO|nr:glycosyl hydrolase family 92 domain-containing protein [Trichoderma breve]KAJ4857208.1 glycosyl hydrolase family 92 domain-containing protein [Trichoderma breve]
MGLPRALVAALAYGSIAHATYDVFDYVDPLIGTSNGGHVFAGATLPFGLAKAVADSVNDNAGGYASDGGPITGFSHMHDSGTGGGASLGNFPLFPQSGCSGGNLDNCYFTKSDRQSLPINSSIEAHPGYFSVTLNTSIKAEMTVSNKTALYRFTFPDQPVPMKGGDATGDNAIPYEPVILADLTDLSDSRSKGSVSVDAHSGRITGSGTFNPSFGVGTYTLYFCTDFQGASIKNTGVFQNNRAGTNFKQLNTETATVTGPPVPGGAFVQFNKPSNNQIIARVGLSFISVNQACSNAQSEIPRFDFQGTQATAEDAWRQKLGVVKVDTTGVSTDILTTFYSGLYRSMISPQDYTGENPLWKSSEPYYDSFYCIWDSFRSIHPLLTIVDPYSQTQMGWTQGGSNADIVLVDAYLKGLHKGVDWQTGYEALISDAEDEPVNWGIEGRGGLTSWKTLGYIPTDDFDPNGVGTFSRSISRTVEYAYNDFCIAEMAESLHKKADAEKYLKRSKNWKNMWNPNQNSGFYGFLQPRYLNGTFGYQDAMMCTPMFRFDDCYLVPTGHETYEGSSWLYTFFAPHDMADLITTLGGPDTFVKRLQFLHNTPNLLYFGDEQAFLLVFLFHYAGRPGLSSYFAHHYIPSQFNSGINGIPGNDDSGAMGAFSTLTMMGLWPMGGQNVYLILPPFFPEISIKNGLTGKTATVKNINFDGGYENIYIQSAKLNGKSYTKNWITHDFFANGGVLELTLGKNESSWGTGSASLPPSLDLDI